MRHVRATVRALASCTLTGLVYVLWVTVSAVIFPSKRTALRWRHFIFRTWARAIAAIMGLRVCVSGPPPSAPFFLVSNHLGYVDIAVFASLLDCVFIAKQDVARWPVIGALCRSMGTIFIDRGSRRDVARVNALIEQTLAERRGVVLFAEGTSSRGATVLPFKTSLLEPVARAGYSVSYAAVSYRAPAGGPPAHLSVCWWGDMAFVDHLFALFRVPEFEATVVFGPQAIRDADRKVLAGRLWHAVAERFVPMVKSEEECGTNGR